METFKRQNPVPLKIRKKRMRDLGKMHRMIANRTFIEGLSLKPSDEPEFQPLAATTSVPDDVDYLIVTDNKRWNEESMLPGTDQGNIVGEFQRLANWKKQRGLRTYIAKIEDIVDGTYGDFKTGARDLQEVIRNFLKSFCASKGVEWVLLGGDTRIVPVRKACGSAANQIRRGEAPEAETGSVPDGVLSGDNTIAWKGSFLGMRVKLDNSGNPVFGLTDHILTNYETGEIIPFDSAGSSNSTTLGWYFCTDDTFATRSVARTQWIRVNGPKNRINNTMVWYKNDNMIPTDLYYSSLYSSQYNQPGKHDWDKLNNGLYGQHKWNDPHMGGTDFIANIGLGRAPIDSEAEAKAFVDKILEYEKWDEDPANNPLTRFRKMLFVSANWGTYHRMRQDGANANPPADNKYYANVASGYSLLSCTKLPPKVGTKLICHLTDTNRRELSYNADADASNPGWYYAKSANDLSSSHTVWNFYIMTIKIPVPTNWIVVYGTDTAELTPIYYALDKDEADSSMTESETLRKWMKSHYHKINQIQRLYTDETDLNPIDYSDGSLRHLTAENLETALNMGPHFVSLSGHGNSNGVAYLSSDLVNRTINGRNTSIMFADSCLTNQFDVNDAMGEHAVKTVGGGAVAYIGNTRYSWIGVGDDFRLEFFKTMQTTRHLADLNDSRCHFANQNNYYHLWVVFSQNLNGDPEMPVYRDVDDAIPRYIGNRNTLELHRSTCQWVEKMAYFNMIAYESVQQGLNAGHDGCYYCLRQHHTH